MYLKIPKHISMQSVKVASKKIYNYFPILRRDLYASIPYLVIKDLNQIIIELYMTELKI